MLVFGLYYFLNKRKNSKKIDIVKVEDPLESIPRAIKYLKPKEPFLRKEQEEFFFHLSMNFRQIIEHTSEIKATDQTFKELKPSLKHNSFFNTNSSIDDILTFLERAEFIKFAEKDVTQQFDITLIEPRLFDSLVSASVFTSRRRVSDSTGLNLGMTTENTYGFSLGTPVYYRDLRLSSRFSALDRIYDSDQTNVIKRSVSPSLTYNTVNHPVFPTGGLKTSIGLTQTGEPFGGNVRLREYRFLYQQFWSLNLDSTLILMAKAQWGMLQQQGGTRIPA
ncbi:MAG: hypothetical protein CMP11_05905, partial [Zetaproteobacteria bacterium]|nr:hypothetical protein [Pseudobdellovibrionaceae bacterium]